MGLPSLHSESSTMTESLLPFDECNCHCDGGHSPAVPESLPPYGGPEPHHTTRTCEPLRKRRRRIHGTAAAATSLQYWHAYVVVALFLAPYTPGSVLGFQPKSFRWTSLLKNHSLSVDKKRKQAGLSASTTIPGGGVFREDAIRNDAPPTEPSWLWTHPSLTPIAAHMALEATRAERSIAPPRSNPQTSEPSVMSSTPTPVRLERTSDAKLQDLHDAKEKWARTYCSVAGLRESFGRNRNVVWGDLDAGSTRRLYKCLLPVALLDLYEATNKTPTTTQTGWQPEDLAPLAYRARVAAKLYARERSRLPARVAAAAYDGFRQWRTYGSFDCTGMSYEQIWNKYAALILQETNHTGSLSASSATPALDPTSSVTAKICLKILERSCQSNEMVDRMVLRQDRSKSQRERDWHQLQAVSAQLERDVRMLLQQEPNETMEAPMISQLKLFDTVDDETKGQRQSNAQKFRALKAVAKVKRRIAALYNPLHDAPSTRTSSDLCP